MNTRLIWALVSLCLATLMLFGCSPAVLPEAESTESAGITETTETMSETESVEAEYSVTAFDETHAGTVKKIVIRDVYTREEFPVTDEDKIGDILTLLDDVTLSYTGMTSKGCYDARITLLFLDEHENKAYSHITLYSGKRCEYKVNSRDSYFNIYDMENGDALFDAVMAYVNEE